jgi:hypothetical protein
MVTLGRTRAQGVIDTLAAELLRAAEDEADMWHRVDDVLGRLAEVERDRLERVLAMLVPDSESENSLDEREGMDPMNAAPPNGTGERLPRRRRVG